MKSFQKVKFKKTVLLFGIVFLVCLFSIIMISGTYIQSFIDPNNDKYQSITLRLSIFFLGSIITMSVFIYNSKQKISSLEYLNSQLPYMMLAGIVFSIFSILTVPTIIFLPSGFQWEKLITTNVVKLPEFIINNIKDIGQLDFTGNISDILSLTNLFTFIASLCTFCLVLYNFIYSFYIKNSIEKNYNKIIKKGKLQKYFNVKSTGIKAKLSDKQCKFIEKKLEKFYQHMIYVISLNDSTLIKTYLEKWQEINSTLILLIFHAKFKDKDRQYREKLYNKILYLSRDLILATSNNISLKEENTHLINFFVNSLPSQEQYFDNSDDAYKKALGQLSKEYFKQSFGIFNHLYESTNKGIYTMILNKEVHFIEKVQSLYKQTMEYKREDLINRYVEDLFTSALFKSISAKSDDLTTIMGLLFITQNNYTVVEKLSDKNDVQTQIVDLMLELKTTFGLLNDNLESQVVHEQVANNKLLPQVIDDKVASDKLLPQVVDEQSINDKKMQHVEDDIKAESSTKIITRKVLNWFLKKMKHNFNGKSVEVDEKDKVIEKEIDILSSRIIENLIIAIAKACEIENYGAAGYLVKRACNHITYSDIENIYPKLKGYFSSKNSKELNTSIISMNPYSLDYCLDKAIFLLLIQLEYISENTFQLACDEEKMLIPKTHIRNIIASLKDRKKDYNLPCIENDNLDSYEKKISHGKDFNRKIGFFINL